ncbi:MAG: response regulator transcription factor [Chloroflexota bacterium]
MVTAVAPARVLIVDSRQCEGDRLRRAMIYDGHEAIVFHNGREGFARVLEGMADLAVIALGTGEYDGLDLCRHLRAHSDLPVLLLGGDGTVAETVAGLEAGADDYLARPADLADVQARVKALLRRTRRSPMPTVWRYADLSVDTATRLVTRSGRRLELTALCFDLLAVFVTHPEQVLTHHFLLAEVWHHPATATTANLEACIHYLRAELEEAGAPRLIQTVRGAGYSLRTQ